MGEFRSQLQASYVSSHTEEFWYSETVCLWMTIYIYIYIYMEQCPMDGYWFKVQKVLILHFDLMMTEGIRKFNDPDYHPSWVVIIQPFLFVTFTHMWANQHQKKTKTKKQICFALEPPPPVFSLSVLTHTLAKKLLFYELIFSHFSILILIIVLHIHLMTHPPCLSICLSVCQS